MIHYNCDLCDKVKDCSQIEIDGRIFDICAECWSPFAEKLRGKGRPRKDFVVIPPLEVKEEKKPEPRKPSPGLPPTIYAKDSKRGSRAGKGL